MGLNFDENSAITTRKVGQVVASFKRCNKQLLNLYVMQNETRMKINELKDEVERDVAFLNLHGWNIREK